MTGAAVAKYEWTLNGKGAVTTETYEVPADAKSGDKIKLVVTAEDGETAEDSVYVGGFTILKVEPTTEAGGQGYKYIRAYFSSSLTSLAPEDIELRSKDTEQLYSIDTVKLSSDGTYADITLFGSVAEGETHFLDGGVIYVMAITNGEVSDSYEFELPIVRSNVLVTNVDTANGKIFFGGATGFEVGDVYEENLGTLVGRSVNVGLNSDNEIEKLSVKKADVVYGVMKYVNKDNDATTISDKDYFEDQVTKTKYYMTTSGTTTINESRAIEVVSGDFLDGALGDGRIDYAKLVLNSNGTVACAVVDPAAWNGGTVKVDSVDGTIVNETSKTSVDLDGYTIEKDGEYVTTADLEEDDVIFYNGNADNKFAEVYTVPVTGEPSDITSTSIAIDGESYKWNAGDSTIVAAKYYKADDDVYTELLNPNDIAGQKVLNNFDPELGVIAYLDRLGNIAYIDGIDKEDAVTTDTWYVTTEAGAGYSQALDSYLKFKVSDGTEQTIEIPVSQLKKFNGVKAKSFTGAEAAVPAGDGSDYEFTFVVDPADIDPATGATKAKPFTDGTPAATLIPAEKLVKITRDDKDKIIGLTVAAPTAVTAIDGDNKGALKPGVTKVTTTIKTTDDTTAKLTDDTVIWVHSTKDGKTTVSKETFGDYTKTTYGLNDLTPKPVVLVDKSAVTDVLLIETFDGTGKSQVFTESETDDVEGIVTGFTEKIKSDDSDTNYVKDVTILTINGSKITYDTLDETIGKTDVPKGKYVLLKVDKATEKITKVDPAGSGWTVTDTIKNAKLNGCSSTEIKTDGLETIQLDSSAIVFKKSGSNYTAIKLNQIATSDKPMNISWHDEYYNADNDIHYADFVVVEDDALAEAAIATIAVIDEANDAFDDLDGTKAAWEDYKAAAKDANDAINAYLALGGTTTTDLDPAYTAFRTDETTAGTTLAAAKTKFASTDYSAPCSGSTHAAVTSLATLTARVTCAEDGIVVPTYGCVTSVAVRTDRDVADTSIAVTATFIDGTTKNATVATAALTEAVYAGDEVWTW